MLRGCRCLIRTGAEGSRADCWSVRGAWLVSARPLSRGTVRAILSLAHMALVCRSHSVYGYVVPKEKLAFSQPTKAGTQLALAYMRPQPVLIYM
jgi:hypothetical protein